MKIAIWTVTRGAAYLGEKLCEKLDAELYSLKKFNVETGIKIESFSEELIKKFNEYQGHIFIMATGIVVRKIATLIKSKDKDPAVIVLDEGMNFAVPLLSGHLGRANELAKILQEKFGIIPILTTSSDVTGKIAVDVLSQKLNSRLESLESAKNVTALIVDNKEVQIFLPKNVTKSSGKDGVIIISNREEIKITKIYPKNLILGIGCRKDSKKETIEKFIKDSFKSLNLSLKSIKKIATVDVKKYEKGLIDLSKEWEIILEIISRDKIKEIENMFEKSKFVEQTIGVGAVSEPCAYLASLKNGKFLLKKAKRDGITLSIYEEKDIDEKR